MSIPTKTILLCRVFQKCDAEYESEKQLSGAEVQVKGESLVLGMLATPSYKYKLGAFAVSAEPHVRIVFSDSTK